VQKQLGLPVILFSWNTFQEEKGKAEQRTSGEPPPNLEEVRVFESFQYHFLFVGLIM
jgi:hypothetical protein